MKVTHLSKWDISGGAAKAAFRLHQGLQSLGHESRMVVQFKKCEDPAVKVFEPPLEFPTRARRFARRHYLERSRKHQYSRRPADANIFSDDRSEHAADVLLQALPTDIINLHWIAGMFDYSQFFRKLGPPTVWTLHDMNAFTGGCHYSGECRKFTHHCEACPQLGWSTGEDFSSDIWRRKRAAYRNLKPNKFCIVTPSHWLAAEAKRSTLFGDFPIKVIPYGLDTDLFKPRDKATARDALGIPKEARVLLFVASSLNAPYKGLAQLLGAVERLRAYPGLFLLIIGGGKSVRDLQVKNLSVGFFEHEGILSLAYSAADLFVLPSLQDNFPNTVLESFACALPVAAFDVGGVSETVRPGTTGVLAEAVSAEALALSIKNVLDDPERLASLSSNCRQVALAEYSLGAQAQRYVELYTSLLESA